MLHGRLTGNKVVNWDIKVGVNCNSCCHGKVLWPVEYLYLYCMDVMYTLFQYGLKVLLEAHLPSQQLFWEWNQGHWCLKFIKKKKKNWINVKCGLVFKVLWLVSETRKVLPKCHCVWCAAWRVTLDSVWIASPHTFWSLCVKIGQIKLNVW